MMGLSGARHDISHLPAGFGGYFCHRRNAFRRRTTSKITDITVPALGYNMLKTRSKNISLSSRTTLLHLSAIENIFCDFFGKIENFH